MLNQYCIKKISNFLRYLYKPKSREATAILTYHGVDAKQVKGCLTLQKFISHLDYFGKECSIVKLSELVRILQVGQRDKKTYVTITFDDAYENFYQYAYPELVKRNLPATLFVPTEFVGNHNSWDYDQRPDHPFLKLMKWEELRKLDGNLIKIGSHGHSHRKMAPLKDEELEVEIMKSKEILESKLHVKIDSFAYPYGELFSFDDRAIRILKDSGYCYAFTTHFGRLSSSDDLFRMNRISIWEEDDIPDINAKLLGYYDWLGPKEKMAFFFRKFIGIIKKGEASQYRQKRIFQLGK